MNKVQEPKTTVTYRGIEYPFYRTNRGSWDFENAGFTIDELVKGSQRAMVATTFFTLRACALRAGLPFTDSLENFIDSSDDIDIPAIYLRIAGNKKDAKTKTDVPEKSMSELPVE